MSKTVTKKHMPSPKTAGATNRLNLVSQAEAGLRSFIDDRELEEGDKLPTEVELGQMLGVSRSVLREAVAALRSKGLLESRQGAGVFVASLTDQTSPLGIFTTPNATISGIIEELELRAAVEIESAGLACRRAAPAQIATILSCHKAFEKALTTRIGTAEKDFEFHCAIAKATNNQRFEAFLTHLGARTIPRAQFKSALERHHIKTDEEKLFAEHEAIVDAILGRDEEAAREAMRRHIGDSLRRYNKLIQLA